VLGSVDWHPNTPCWHSAHHYAVRTRTSSPRHVCLVFLTSCCFHVFFFKSTSEDVGFNRVSEWFAFNISGRMIYVAFSGNCYAPTWKHGTSLALTAITYRLYNCVIISQKHVNRLWYYTFVGMNIRFGNWKCHMTCFFVRKESSVISEECHSIKLLFIYTPT
jgi:hypothetical protein